MSVSIGTFGLISSYSISANKGADRSAETTGTIAYSTLRDSSVKEGTETTGAVAFHDGISQNTSDGFAAVA